MQGCLTADPGRCPLCAGDNRCAVAAGERSCWCFAQVVPGDVIAQLPQQARGRACVCAACAARESAAARR